MKGTITSVERNRFPRSSPPADNFQGLTSPAITHRQSGSLDRGSTPGTSVFGVRVARASTRQNLRLRREQTTTRTKTRLHPSCCLDHWNPIGSSACLLEGAPATHTTTLLFGAQRPLGLHPGGWAGTPPPLTPRNLLLIQANQPSTFGPQLDKKHFGLDSGSNSELVLKKMHPNQDRGT
jgi:hypothetical protein